MGIFDSIANRIADGVLAGLQRDDWRHEYRVGNQKKMLRTKPGAPDYNMSVNFTGLIVDRSVSAMLGKGVRFDLPGDSNDTPEDVYLSAAWDANKQQVLLMRAALMAAEQGTGFIKIQNGGVVSLNGKEYPRLIAVDPRWVQIVTAPEDKELVMQYLITYAFTGPDGKERARQQRIEIEDGVWYIRDYQDTVNGRMEMVGEEVWPFDFCPMIHWQNLPSTDTAEGVSDIGDDMRVLQDRINRVASNMDKIIHLYAHPQRWGKMLGQNTTLQMGPDDMPSFSSADAAINQLEPLGDLAGAREFLRFLRQSFFDISRTVDIDSMQDKIGSLTNFGLRVLYNDALAKIATKRELMGDALAELCARLLVMGGFDAQAVTVVWPDVLPSNAVEDTAEDKQLVEMSIKSRQTVAMERGLDWETEQERIRQEKTASSDIGTALLGMFDRGQ